MPPDRSRIVNSGVCQRQRINDTCGPRCDVHTFNAHVCPAPGRIEDFMRLFDRTFVLCLKANCLRHQPGGYWPPTIADRVVAMDGEELDEVLAARLGGRGAAFLKSDLQTAGTAQSEKHRVLTFFAQLELVRIAASRGLRSVLIIEADFTPITANTLKHDELRALSVALRRQPWSIVRAAGMYRCTNARSGRKPTVCPPACACAQVASAVHACIHMHAYVRACVRTSTFAQVAGLRRACRLPTNSSACGVRNSVAYAVGKAAFPTFLATYNASFARLQQRYEAWRRHGPSRPPQPQLPHEPQQQPPPQSCANHPIGAHGGNNPWNRDYAHFPWFDAWLPDTFESPSEAHTMHASPPASMHPLRSLIRAWSWCRSMHILPSFFAQQTKKGDVDSSRAFQALCSQPSSMQESPEDESPPQRSPPQRSPPHRSPQTLLSGVQSSAHRGRLIRGSLR